MKKNRFQEQKNEFTSHINEINNRIFNYTLYVEIKPIIKSFGETLRQLKSYEQWQENSTNHIVLFTPDLKFKDAFESQNIVVKEYKPNQME